MSQSKEIFIEAKKHLVGGVNSPVRSFSAVADFPLAAKKADGAFLWDADDKKYIDFVMSYGPHLFGHQHEPIKTAIKKSLDYSTCLGMNSELELLWAKKALEKLPFAEKIRAVSTGTEATATAIRLARGYTGRDLIVKFSGHYHGHVDSLLVDVGSGAATLSRVAKPGSKGVPKSLAELVRLCEFNDLKTLQDIFKKEGDKIAAIILEPVMGNMGVIAPDQLFLKGCRTLCDEHESLLIFDEVMCGFRIHPHSTEALFQVLPDLGCYGKIIGGGLPLAALAGPSKIMDHLSPLGEVYQAGTLSGNPVAISAGLAMLEEIEKRNPYEELEKFGSELQKHLEALISECHLKMCVSRVASMMSLFFRTELPTNAVEARDIDKNLFNKFFNLSLEEGIMFAPSPFEAFFLSTAHIKHKALIFESFENILRKL